MIGYVAALYSIMTLCIKVNNMVLIYSNTIQTSHGGGWVFGSKVTYGKTMRDVNRNLFYS